VQGVSSTGTLQPVDTVEVGTQVSGTIKTLGANFNSIVKKGQVIATLDPALFQSQVEQSRASVARLRADLEQSRVQVKDAQQKLSRAKALQGEQLIAQSDFDAAAIGIVESMVAEICKIATVPHALIPLASGELSYITRRIDRSGGIKIHMEDFCQLSELLTEDKYKSSMEKVGKLAEEFSMYPGLDLVNLFELTIFNYVTGNNDMHLKNFSLINHGEGWQLSPAYDLLNVNLVNEKDNEESALTIFGKKRKLKKQDFLQLGITYKLNDAQIRNAFKNILGKEEQMTDFIKISFLTNDYKTKYIQILKARCQVLKEN